VTQPPPGPIANGLPAAERRLSDRRRQPTRPWDAVWGWARRRGGRREADTRIYVDVFQTQDILMILGVFFLNLADALFTLVYLNQGGSEANPWMAHLLEISDSAFLFQKCVVVGIWLVYLTIHKNWALARLGLRVLFVLYAVLLLYHGVLQAYVARA
jgi:hypothetical protein